MRTSILNTEFNFAKSINISLIAASIPIPSFQQIGITSILSFQNQKPKPGNGSTLLSTNTIKL